MSEHANNLRSIAQNDYMIDQHFLPDGEALNKAADRIEELENRRVFLKGEGGGYCFRCGNLFAAQYSHGLLDDDICPSCRTREAAEQAMKALDEMTRLDQEMGLQ